MVGGTYVILNICKKFDYLKMVFFSLFMENIVPSKFIQRNKNLQRIELTALYERHSFYSIWIIRVLLLLPFLLKHLFFKRNEGKTHAAGVKILFRPYCS